MIQFLSILFIFILIGYVLSWIAKRALLRWLRANTHTAFRNTPFGDMGDMNASEPPSTESLVQCHHCHTFIPRSRAISEKNGYSCKEHSNNDPQYDRNT